MRSATPARRPTALWVTPVSDLAGVARHILDVARAGLPGWRLVVTAPEGPLLEQLRRLGCPVVPLDVEGRPVPAVVADLRRIVRRLRPSIVHSHLAKADFLAAMATAGLPTTLISTEHHIPEDPLIFHGTRRKALSRQLAHRARIHRFAHLIAVSESTRRDMLRYWHPSAPIEVILNGIDRPASAPERRAGLRVLSLTRLAPEKNLKTTLAVFARVQMQHPDARLTIAGTGPQEASLRATARRLGLEGVVSFPGFVDAERALREHDVLLQPSKADNLSYTLLDAVSHGLGVVASPIGGNPEILPEQCIVPADDEAAMATAVIAQGLEPGIRPRLPQAVPTVAQMTDRITQVYDASGTAPGAAPVDVSAPTLPIRPKVSVLIAYYKNQETIRMQLNALVAQLNPPAFEVVIADNEGSATLRTIVADFRARLDARVVAATDRRGQCHARNTAARAARAGILAFCDADDVVTPTWLRALADAVTREDVLATGPLRLDRINPEPVWRCFLEMDPAARVEIPALLHPFVYLDYQRFAWGCNIGIRSTTFSRLGGFDESFIGGSEDVDLSWRALESGLEIIEMPAATVDYHLRPRPAEVFRQRREYSRAQLRVWSRSVAAGRPVRGMSLRWAIRETLKLGPAWIATRDATVDERYRLASWSGSVVGNLEGQLAERVFTRPDPGRRVPSRSLRAYAEGCGR